MLRFESKQAVYLYFPGHAMEIYKFDKTGTNSGYYLFHLEGSFGHQSRWVHNENVAHKMTLQKGFLMQ